MKSDGRLVFRLVPDVEGDTKERLEDGIRIMEVKLPHRALV